MAIITITSDWNKKEYLPPVIGRILGICPQARIVEISSEIRPYSLNQAAWLLGLAVPWFPPSTLHLLLVDAALSETIRPVVVKAMDQFFLGPDNGLFSLFLEDIPYQVFELPISPEDRSSTFPELRFFAKVAAEMALQETIPENAIPKDTYRKIQTPVPVYQKDGITGIIVWMDSYGNIQTNVEKGLFERIGQGRSFRVFVGNDEVPVSCLSRGYGDVGEGDWFVVLNSRNFIEIGQMKSVHEPFRNLLPGVPVSFFF